jgi:dCTP deaminase
MVAIDEKKILNQLIFEIIERISRFSSHLEEIKIQFYNSEDSIVRDKLIFISSYEECLVKYFQITISYLKIIDEDKSLNIDNYLNKLESILFSINDLHQRHLTHLPRPNEPIELRRFGRVIKKQIFNIEKEKLSKNNPISIYINEDIGEFSYASDPLSKFKLDNINTLVFEFNSTYSSIKSIAEFENVKFPASESSIYITISRIDSSNPCHWPSLLHEVSHGLMQSDWFEQNDIYSDFEQYLKEQDAFENLDLIKEIKVDVKSWLTECWCDLFACASMGPSFYFSQYHSFLNFLKSQDNVKYPPFLFRLKLIEKILYHRFRSVFKKDDLDKEIHLTQTLLSFFEKNQQFSFKSEPNLRRLFLLFKEYFLDHLFKAGEGNKITLHNTELNSKFQKTVRYVNEINPERIIKLATELDKGYPIPGYTESVQPKYIEKPTSVQEILFAAWIYRNTTFRERIIEILRKNLGAEMLENFDELKKFLKEVVCMNFMRLDQSLLRSIQVSEYFDAFCDNNDTIEENIIEKAQTIDAIATKNLLVDVEIIECLKKEEIRIIPIMSLYEQAGSTSIDIRLGSTVELYLPNQFGILDFTESESLKKISQSAQRINLDFLEPIAVNPGQFILAHSMEYIKLADSISADLEGRSSFARLGIEVHMTAGFIDPGFEGVLTFEIFNAGPSPVKLYPGMRIGQLRFTRTSIPNKSYRKKHTAKYSGLLEYNSSKQNKDYEMKRIRNLKEKDK